MTLPYNNIVDQREVQRWGKGCGRFPTSCVVRHLLVAANLLKPLGTLTVWDMTFGEGRFWVLIPQVRVIGWDIRKLKWYRLPFQFFKQPCWAWRYEEPSPHPDLVAIDPPWSRWQRGGRDRAHYWINKMEGTPEHILNYCGKAASEHFGVPLLVHYKDRWVPDGFRIVTEVWYQAVVRNMKMPKPSWFAILEPE